MRWCRGRPSVERSHTKSCAPGGGGRGSLLGSNKLLAAVGGLGPTVGLTEDRAEDWGWLVGRLAFLVVSRVYKKELFIPAVSMV